MDLLVYLYDLPDLLRSIIIIIRLYFLFFFLRYLPLKADKSELLFRNCITFPSRNFIAARKTAKIKSANRLFGSIAWNKEAKWFCFILPMRKTLFLFFSCAFCVAITGLRKSATSTDFFFFHFMNFFLKRLALFSINR